MGIIKRQGIKSTIVNYIGVVVGTLSILFIYPLDDEIYGYANWLYNTSYLLIPLASGGILSLVVKYFPAFNNKESGNYNGFLSLILFALLTVFLVFVAFWFLFNEQFLGLLDLLNLNSKAISLHQNYILLLLLVLIILNFLLNHSFNMFRIVVPNLVQQVGYKLYLPILVLLYLHFEFSRTAFSYLLIMYFGLAILIMILYLHHLGALKFSKIKRPYKDFSFKEMGVYSIFGSLNGISNSLAFRIDNVMIPLLLDMVKNGIYNKVFFIANVIEMPTRAMNQITAPVISKAWEEGDIEEIGTVYTKASANLFLIGSFFFLVIWYVLDDLVAISANPDAFPDARVIFLLLAFGKLIDMLMSVNSQIITYSKAYRYHLVFMVVLGISNLVLNYLLIQKYELLGAALATSCSLLIYNLLKYVFIKVKFDLHPFSMATLKTLFLLGSFLLLWMWVPFFDSSLLNIILKPIFVMILYGGIAIYWKISPDVNNIIFTFINKIKPFR